MQENGDYNQNQFLNGPGSFAGSGMHRYVQCSSFECPTFAPLLNIYIQNVFASAVAGKDFEGDKEGYSSAEWQERVEKWKIRQEKRGLVTKDDGGNDPGDEDDDFV